MSTEIENIKTLAYKNGFDDGHNAGYDKGYEEGFEEAEKKYKDKDFYDPLDE